MGDGIRHFKGELLWAPEALELSMNWCGHQCSYCYANARKPNRKADLPAIMGLLAHYRRRTTTEAKLLQLGYPVNVSNHVDVFAGTNAAQFEPIWEVMIDQEIPIVFQTRGAHKPQQKILDRVIAETPPSVWYVSIPMWDDSIRKQVEPHAPSIPYRLDLIAQIKAAGHEVVVGANPTCVEWLPEFRPLVDRCKALGVWGFWYSRLYFGRTFGEKLTPKQVDAITPELISRCGVSGSMADHQHIMRMIEYVSQAGMQSYYHRADRPTGFFDAWKRIYPRVMPMLQDLINYAHALYETEGNASHVVLSIDDALIAMPRLPDVIDYGPFFHSDVKQFRIESGLSQGAKLPSLDAKGFWDLMWRSAYFSKKAGPLSASCFAWASTSDGDIVVPLLDDERRPLLVYRPAGYSSMWAETPELA